MRQRVRIERLQIRRRGAGISAAAARAAAVEIARDLPDRIAAECRGRTGAAGVDAIAAGPMRASRPVETPAGVADRLAAAVGAALGQRGPR